MPEANSGKNRAGLAAGSGEEPAPDARTGGRNFHARFLQGGRLARLILACAAGSVLLLVAVWMDCRSRIRLLNPEPSLLVEDRQGRFLSAGPGGDASLGFWPVDGPLPARISACLLAIEDRRFFQHGGVEGRSLLRAFLHNLSAEGTQGGSTIAMQVARLQDPGPRTLWRKLEEAFVARGLTSRYGHQAILRQYLRLVPQGNQIHGVAFAARRYFQKPLQDLSWAEAAVLAALPKAPGIMNIYRPEGRYRALARARLVLASLYAQGGLDEDSYHTSLRELGRMTLPDREKRPPAVYHALLRMAEDGRLQAGTGRPVRISLDLEIQEKVLRLARTAVETYRPLGAGNVAVIVASRETGEILAYAGSADYFDHRWAGSINYANTPRAAGSTVKPFIYAAGLMRGTFTPASVLPDLPLHIAHPSGDYVVTNYDGDFLGPMLYRRALANSRNVPAVLVLKQTGLAPVYDFLGNLGLLALDRGASHYGLGLAVGNLEITLERLVEAFGTLANDGREFHLRWHHGRAATSPAEWIPAGVARQIMQYLSDPLARAPSFGRLGALEYSFPVAIKTGTSQGYRDAWAVAASSRYLTGAWLGDPEGGRMNQVSGLAAARLVREIMLEMHPEENRGVGIEPFPPPAGCVSSAICPLSGALAGEDCTSPVLEYFVPGTEPVHRCTVHRRLAVDTRTGTLAGPDTPPDRVAIRSFLDFPPEYRSWASRQGYAPLPLPPLEQVARISIQEPADGSSYRMDPDTPAAFQTMALRAEVLPAVPEIHWYVDGRFFCQSAYPYTARLPLTPGQHSIQARFARARVLSKPVRIEILP